jgi:hypothetical protein
VCILRGRQTFARDLIRTSEVECNRARATSPPMWRTNSLWCDWYSRCECSLLLEFEQFGDYPRTEHEAIVEQAHRNGEDRSQRTPDDHQYQESVFRERMNIHAHIYTKAHVHTRTHTYTLHVRNKDEREIGCENRGWGSTECGSTTTETHEDTHPIGDGPASARNAFDDRLVKPAP